MVLVTVCTPSGAGSPTAGFEGYLEPNIPVNSVKDGAIFAGILNPMGEAVKLKWRLHLGKFYPVGETLFYPPVPLALRQPHRQLLQSLLHWTSHLPQHSRVRSCQNCCRGFLVFSTEIQAGAHWLNTGW